jgi:probable rRNA maturation factor
MPRVDIQRGDVTDGPDDARILRSVSAALAAAGRDSSDVEVSLRIVGESEMQTLNAQYRGRDYATNVLSFPAEFPPGLDLPLIGDIAICAPVVTREAQEQGKTPAAHWDHMLTHGVLHLLGYDHETDADAAVMENLERRALASLGHGDPYEGDTDGDYPVAIGQ